VPKKKPTAAEIELQLSERRFILEAITAGSTLLQVPIITAFVWYYLSRTNANFGVLNKAILTAELTPLIGDIKFPEGVLLGAAMESSEDMLKILDKAGLLDDPIETIKNTAIEKAQDTGDFIGDQFIRIIPDRTCEHWNKNLREDFEKAKKNIFSFSSLDFVIKIKKMKTQGCERPDWIGESTWSKI